MIRTDLLESFISNRPGRIRFRPASGVLSITFVLAPLLLGCANPGVPRPPSLHLPAVVTDLSATRIADRVELRWTSPTSTTDGLPLTTPTTVIVCRDSPALPSAPCTPVLSVSGHPGISTAVDHLAPQNITSVYPRSLLAYRVRVLNSNGRSAEPSPAVLVPGGSPPAPVQGFRVSQQKSGVTLTWDDAHSSSRPDSETTVVEVSRVSLDQPVPAPGSLRQSLAGPNRPAGHENSPESIVLRPETSATSASRRDITGMVDDSTLEKHSYRYSARRVLSVPGAHGAMEIFSEGTSPVDILRLDTYPPEAPTGLTSIPVGAGNASVASIDLTWRPSEDPDLLGYLVYRADLSRPEAKPERIVREPIPGPAYRDLNALAGHRYRYHVTAVDRSGNESAPSLPVTEIIGSPR